jgi:HTH-type transcriptional regulator / antitoxin HigA
MLGLITGPLGGTPMAPALSLDFSKPHVLRNAREYNAAVRAIDALLDADPPRGSEGYERLEFLSVLVEAYEDAHDPVDDGGTPQSAVLFALSQRELTRVDLVPLLGSRSRVSEFLSGKCRLSLTQIRRLHEAFGIPADLLIA